MMTRWKTYSWQWAFFCLIGVLGSCDSSPLGSDEISVLSQIYDLGDIPHGKTKIATFTLVNPEKASLKLTQIVVSCTCARLDLKVTSRDGRTRVVKKEELPSVEKPFLLRAGERLETIIYYITSLLPAVPRKINEPVQFYFNHPTIKSISCRIKGRVLLRLAVKPMNTTFGTFSQSQRASMVVDLASLKKGRPVKVLGFKGAEGLFQIKIISVTPNLTRIRFKTAKKLELGPFDIPIVILTDLDGDYRLPIHLKGNVVPDLSIDPPPPLPLGRVVPGKESKATTLVEWRHPTKTIRIRVKSWNGPAEMKARLIQKEKGRTWRLEVTCLPNEKTIPGIIKGEVILVTSDPDIGQIRVPVKGYMSKKQ